RALGDAMPLMRLFLTILAGFMGIFGILWGYTAILLHLCTLRSLGVPYLSPLAPATAGNLKDVLVRAPWWAMLRRPHPIGQQNPRRQEPSLASQPPAILQGGEE
ncbi:MAG: spore germination protein, partial [Moorella sp. (in: Bacteria)]|nr:spore germination protein [Moorella sp. (in: firmicutes)]